MPHLHMGEMRSHHHSGANLDSLSSPERDVIIDALLYSMAFQQRAKLKSTYPGIYSRLFPNHNNHDLGPQS